MSAGPVLSVRDLTVSVARDEGWRPIVDGVSFDLQAGQILGLVGESGSGKSMTCRALMRLLPGARLAITGGSIRLGEEELTALDEAAMRKVRGGQIGMIFQNPSSHLDPVMTIGAQIAETIRFHQGASRREAMRQAIEVLRQVGIPDPTARAGSYPHEFSGGMRQRAMIAVALACQPKVLIADEPTTALDVTVQAQILRLLLDLRDSKGLSIIFITHDLGVVSQTCDSIAVMYGGRLAELGPKRDIIRAARHPYTAGLIRCQPGAAATGTYLETIPGQPPTVDAMPSGCRFHPRCPRAGETCREHQPAFISVDLGHRAACHFPEGPGQEAAR
ncbi:ABC transporter ATP-binding protein [Radicibacter daui]|uniref:ABC transporter ATP-binding protein n=1 Tax=Radicibacter daui TaxID=3064829 RepID=UPI004046AA51